MHKSLSLSQILINLQKIFFFIYFSNSSNCFRCFLSFCIYFTTKLYSSTTTVIPHRIVIFNSKKKKKIEPQLNSTRNKTKIYVFLLSHVQTFVLKRRQCCERSNFYVLFDFCFWYSVKFYGVINNQFFSRLNGISGKKGLSDFWLDQFKNKSEFLVKLKKE